MFSLNSELYWTVLSQLIQFIGTLGLFKLLTVGLEKIEYGYFALVLSISAFVVAVPFSALVQGIIKYIPEYKEKNELDFFLSSFVVLFIYILLFYLLIFFLLNSYLSQEQLWKISAAYIVLFVVSEVLKTSLYAVLNGLRERKVCSVAIISEYFLKTLIVLAASMYYELSFMMVLITYSLANMISVIYCVSKLPSKVKLSINRFYVKQVFIFSLPLAVWAVFGWAREMSNRWYIDMYLDKPSIASFAVLGSLSMVIPSVFLSFVSAYVTPIIYSKERNMPGYASGYIKTIVSLGLPAAIIISCVVWSFDEQILLFLASEKYIGISHYLAPMFLAYMLFVISMLSTIEIFSYGKTGLLLGPNLLSGIVALISGMLLIKHWGVEGAVASFILSYCCYAFYVFFIVFKFNYKKAL